MPTGKAEEVKVEIIDTGAKLETPLFTGDDLKGMDMKTFLMRYLSKRCLIIHRIIIRIAQHQRDTLSNAQLREKKEACCHIQNTS